MFASPLSQDGGELHAEHLCCDLCQLASCPTGTATDLQRSTDRQEPGRPEIGKGRFEIAGEGSRVGVSDAVECGAGRLAKRPGVLTVLPWKRDVRRDWTFTICHGSCLTSSREDSAPLRVDTTRRSGLAAQ